MDIPFAWSTAHRDEDQWAWNILYGDGHVELCRSAEASACIQTDPTISVDWAAFGELMGLLER